MKNANFFQKNIEKIILGAALVVSLALVLLYVVGSPYTAAIRGQSLSTSEVEQQVRTAVQQLESGLNNPTATVEEIEVFPYSQELRQRTSRELLPTDRFASIAGRPGLSPRHVQDPGAMPAIDLPRPPVATGLAVRRGHGVLGAFEVGETGEREFVSLIGNRQPMDFQYVSVSAEFPMDEWVERLNNSDNLPKAFWRAMIGLAGVYLQREELDPATGQWGNRTLVQPLPNQVAFLPDQARQFDDQTAFEAVDQLRASQDNVARPEFPPLAAGIMWMPPGSGANLTPDEQRELRSLRDRIRRLEQQIEQLDTEQQMQRERQQQRQQRNQRTERQPRTPTRTPGGPGGPGDFGGMMDPGMMGPDMGGARGRMGPGAAGRQRNVNPGQRGDDYTERRAQIAQQLQELRQQHDELLDLPEDLLRQQQRRNMQDPYGAGYGPGMDPYDMMGGYDPAMFPPGMDPFGGMGPGMQGQFPGQRGRAPAGQQAQQEPQGPQTVQVWAHDLTVEPGKTYRYRVIAAVLNPLFRQMRVPEEQREVFFNRIALGPSEEELANAPWSEPVRVDPESYFFFLQGSPQSQTARVEVWRIFNGQWQREEFTVQPGDPLGGTMQVDLNGQPREIELKADAVVVDLAQSAAGGPMGASDALLLYLDQRTGQISTRSVSADRENPDRVRLMNEAALQEQFQEIAMQQ